jgi:hypothetical protein
MSFGIQQKGRAGVFFDQIMYWYGLSCLVIMYSLVGFFWKNLCRKNNSTIGWFDSEQREIRQV